MSNIVKNYFKILEVISSLNIVLNTENRDGRRFKMSDLEVVALSLTAEYMSIDSENSLFNQLQNGQITNLIERSQYNKRRKKLSYFAEQIRQQLYSKFTEFETYFVVDSMPLEICKMARHTRINICKDDFQTSPDKGFCASQNTWFYGYKLHAVCTVSSVFQSIDITKASVHDVHLLKDLKYQMSDCVLLGDRGYLSSTLQLDLFETVNIKLETPMRTNQKGYKNNLMFLENQEKE